MATLTHELRLRGGARAGGTGFVILVLGYLMAGLFMGVVMHPGVDPFTAGLIACSVLMVLLLAFVAMEFSQVILSPEDLTFYLPLPVTARTLSSSKLLVLCTLSVAFAVAFAVPLLNIAAFRGISIATVGGLLYSLVTSAVTITLLTTAILGGALHLVPSRWIRSTAAYLQLAFLLLFYGGFALAQGLLRDALSTLEIPLAPPLLLAPSSWGPSILHSGSAAILGVGLSLAGPVLLFVTSMRTLTPFFEGSSVEPRARAERPRRRSRIRSRSLLWRSQEERAIVELIRNRFRHDPQFRVASLMLKPGGSSPTLPESWASRCS